MATTISREEHARRQRRRRRQLIGLGVVVLVILGIMNLISIVVNLYKAATDNTEEMNQYQSLLRGVVLYDPPAFDGLENAPANLVKESSVWGVIYNLLDKDGSLDSLERAEDERAILPAVDVEEFAVQLYGPDVELTHETFTDDYGLEYVYDEELNGYLIPVTSTEVSYSPKAVEMKKKGNTMTITVGYIRNEASGDLTTITATEPQKYMDFIFTRGSNRNWYLTSLQDSEMQVETEDIVQEEILQEDADYSQILQEQIEQDETIQVEPTEAPAETDSAASTEGEESAEESTSEAESTESSGEAAQ